MQPSRPRRGVQLQRRWQQRFFSECGPPRPATSTALVSHHTALDYAPLSWLALFLLPYPNLPLPLPSTNSCSFLCNALPNCRRAVHCCIASLHSALHHIACHSARTIHTKVHTYISLSLYSGQRKQLSCSCCISFQGHQPAYPPPP